MGILNVNRICNHVATAVVTRRGVEAGIFQAIYANNISPVDLTHHMAKTLAAVVVVL